MRHRSVSRPHPPVLTACIVGLAIVLGACTSSEGDDDRETDTEDADEAAAEAEEELEEEVVDTGPAPAAVTTGHTGGVAVRIDEVRRAGDRIDVVFTLATRDEHRFDDSRVRFLTNSGIELPRAPEQERTIPGRSQATIEASASGVTEQIRTLQLEVADLTLTFDVPEDGEVIAWAPAPERQVGLIDALMRDNSPVVVVPYTFRTEGLISEVTFTAQVINTHEPSLCYFRQHRCQLEDASGRIYPMLWPSHEFGPRERASGTLRFLGEIPRDQTELRLRLSGSSGFMTTPDPEFSHEFTLPRAEDSPLRAVGGLNHPEPFDVDQTLSTDIGLEITLGELSFADDRIQLEVVYELEDRDGNWVKANYRGDSLLRDPGGHEHPLRGPTDDPEMRIEGGQRLEASLVFLTPMAPGTSQLQLVLATGDSPVETTIEVPAPPARDDTEDDN